MMLWLVWRDNECMMVLEGWRSFEGSKYQQGWLLGKTLWR